jgi:FG-GAP-like repeat
MIFKEMSLIFSRKTTNYELKKRRLLFKNILYIVLSFVFFCSCKNEENVQEGKVLAQQYCGSCHQFPEAEMLAKKDWSKVLPLMALRLGIKSEVKNIDSLNAFEKEVLVEKQIISDKDWAAIKNYYQNTAPDTLNNSNKTSLTFLRNLFEIRIPQTLPEEVPNITAIKIDKKRNQVYAADEINKQIYFLDKNAKIVANFKGLPAISDFEIADDKLFVTYIGRDIRLTKQLNGYNELVSINKTAITNTEVVLKNLYRPVSSILANLDNSPDNEVITCEFGVNKGKFAIWKKNIANYKEVFSEDRAGAIHTQVIDLDNDGKQDVITLFTQGDEQLVCYRNLGNLKFERIQLLRFPPINGSNYFEIVDIDADGKLDILYTCGDNADYSITQKPYHGVYIYKNKGNNTFEKTSFFPVDGATKSIARDFDNDGDLDIATIAFFANFHNPSTSNFIYFENNNGKFDAKGLDVQRHGRWLVMDAADIDADGDIDIALGSHPFGETISPHLDSWRNSTGVLILLNQTLPKSK